MTSASRLLVFALIPALAFGCSKPDSVEITDSVVKSEHAYQEKIGATSDERFLSREEYAAKQAAEAGGAQSTGLPADHPPLTDAPAAATPTADPFHYSTPDGWTALAPTQFRQINLAIGNAGDMECYLTILPGGGGIAENINRWRGQFGVAEYTEDEIAGLPDVVIMGFPGKVVNFSGDFTPRGASAPLNDYRLIGAIMQSDDQLITIKMTGPEAKIMTELNNFAKFVDSLHPNDGHTHGDTPAQPTAGAIPPGAQMPADHPPLPGQPAAGVAPSGPAPTSAGNYEWTVPEGWNASSNTSSMRLVTFTVTDQQAAGEAECYITVLTGDGGGRLLNYNRWLGQFDQDPLEESELILQPPVYLFGEEVPMLVCEGTYQGMGGTPAPDQMLIGASGMINGETLFIKLVGPRDVVRGNWAAFARFCDSLKAKAN